MILKSYEINKIDLNKNKIILLYGKNDGFKNEAVKEIIKKRDSNLHNFDEKDILENVTSFVESIRSKSLFEEERIILIKRSTDKSLQIIQEIENKNLEDLIIIFNADILDKKSKLRSFFEKNKKYLCVPFYPDNEQTLLTLTQNFLREKKISLSPSNINLLIRRSSGNRETLFNELFKIENFSMTRKKLSYDDIVKLTNLVEDHSVSELIDNCLAKNTKKTINILNENSFNNEDCFLITRVFLNKSKKILELSREFQSNKNLELTISKSKPPIFWKDKEITKQQISKWSPENIKTLIYRLNEIELTIKKNVNNSKHLITNFILEQLSTKSNN
jgi:DNA polymerase-3 subunit delta